MNPTSKIAIVCRAMLMRQCLITLLQPHRNINVLFNAKHKEQLFSHLKYKVPDIVLLNVDTFTTDALELLAALREFPQIKTITLLEEVSDTLILQLLERDAKAILTRHTTLETLITAIAEVHNNGFHYSEEVMQVINRRSNWSTISPAMGCITAREAEILHLVCQGKSSRQIAGLLFISIKTVENHRYNLLRKTSSKNQVELKQWVASLYDHNGSES